MYQRYLWGGFRWIFHLVRQVECGSLPHMSIGGRYGKITNMWNPPTGVIEFSCSLSQFSPLPPGSSPRWRRNSLNAPPTPIQPSGATQRDQRPNKGASSLLNVHTYHVKALGPIQAVALGSTSGRANCSRQEKTRMQVAAIPLGSSSSLFHSLVQEVSSPHRNSSWALPFEILRGRRRADWLPSMARRTP